MPIWSLSWKTFWQCGSTCEEGSLLERQHTQQPGAKSTEQDVKFEKLYDSPEHPCAITNCEVNKEKKKKHWPGFLQEKRPTEP